MLKEGLDLYCLWWKMDKNTWHISKALLTLSLFSCLKRLLMFQSVWKSQNVQSCKLLFLQHGQLYLTKNCQLYNVKLITYFLRTVPVGCIFLKQANQHLFRQTETQKSCWKMISIWIFFSSLLMCFPISLLFFGECRLHF